MTHPRTSARRSAQPTAAPPGRSDAATLEAALQLSHLPPDELRELVLAFRAFRKAHPRNPISLLDFAGEYQARLRHRERPKT